jgi:hypothetical protein
VGYREEQVLLIRGGGKQIISIVEMSRKTEVERGAPEKQMTRDQRGNSNKENPDCQKYH